MTLTKRFLADLTERAVRTFAQAYLAYWTVQGAGFDRMLTLDGLKIAAAATGFAVLTAIVAKPVGNPESASMLPPEAQPPAPLPLDETLRPEDAAPFAGDPGADDILAEIEALRRVMVDRVTDQVAARVVAKLDEQVAATPRRGRTQPPAQPPPPPPPPPPL